MKFAWVYCIYDIEMLNPHLIKNILRMFIDLNIQRVFFNLLYYWSHYKNDYTLYESF